MLCIRFSEDLGFFLDRKNLGTRVLYDADRRASVKDVIESLGIPHTEVGGLRFNGQGVDFSFIPDKGGELRVEGVAPGFDVRSPDSLRPLPLSEIKFLADLNVIKLGRYLLLLGFDVALGFGMDDAEIADLALSQGRIVLTRDTRLLFRKKIDFARRIRASDPMAQVTETLACFGLAPDPMAFFTRCTQCNQVLKPVEKEAILHLLEPRTRKYYNRFFQCPACSQVFWKGSHHHRIRQRFSRLGILKNH